MQISLLPLNELFKKTDLSPFLQSDDGCSVTLLCVGVFSPDQIHHRFSLLAMHQRFPLILYEQAETVLWLF